MNKKNKTLVIRIDDALLNQLTQQAIEDRRSLSEYVYLMILDESIKRHTESNYKDNLVKPLMNIN